ncbi:hypothetical protein TNCV_1336931 [Trichonephila clavipes]|nr:hypothetical protein TNCV_1336931 [Trichonephila clavipes]
MICLRQGSATYGSQAICSSLDVKLRLFSSLRKYYLFYQKKTFKNRSESIDEDYAPFLALSHLYSLFTSPSAVTRIVTLSLVRRKLSNDAVVGCFYVKHWCVFTSALAVMYILLFQVEENDLLKGFFVRYMSSQGSNEELRKLLLLGIN